MKKIILAVLAFVLFVPVLAQANPMDMICVGALKHKLHTVSIEPITRQLKYDNETFYYADTKKNDGFTFNNFMSTSNKSVVMASNATSIAFMEFTGDTKTDYGLCSPK